MDVGITINVKGAVFAFNSYAEWRDNASGLFEKHNLTALDVLCIDTKNRVCKSGAEFTRADYEHAYPVIAYEI